jgi:hypothetical protein
MERIAKRTKSFVAKRPKGNVNDDKKTHHGNLDNINFFLNHPKKNKVIAYHMGVLPMIILERLQLLGCTVRNISQHDPSLSSNSNSKKKKSQGVGAGHKSDVASRFQDVDLFIYKKTSKSKQAPQTEKAAATKQVSYNQSFIK